MWCDGGRELPLFPSPVLLVAGDGVTLVVVQTPHKKEEVAEAKKEEE